MAVAFALQAPLAINAQDAQPVVPSAQPQTASFQDPPGRVARLSFIEGSVSFQPGGENDWVTAERNRPLVTGDSLWADEDSRAEIHLGSTALRLGASTSITLLEVSDQAAQVSLTQGSLIVRVRHVDDQDSYEVDTPNMAFTVMQPGDYRIDVDPDGNRTEVVVWSGSGVATGVGSSHTVSAGQHATFTGSDRLNYERGQLPGNDGFDTWASSRDQAEDQSDSANYVSRDMTGYEDLDAYGSWSNVDGYGMVWQPTDLAVGWAPYRFGHWAWIGPWGWTWVENEPWGFAPFHYGRWAYAGTRWVWVPGPSGARPAYAPHLVAWVGGGPGSNFAFSFGPGVGWFPLAPGEVFVPGYRVSRTYVNNVNLSNTRLERMTVTNVYNAAILSHGTSFDNLTYANRGINGGVTVVSHDTFINARPVAGNLVSVPVKELAAAPVSHMVAVEPLRTSVVGAGLPAANHPPAVLINRPVVALRTPPAMPRPFDQQAGTHSNPQPLIRQALPGRPVASTPTTSPAPSQDASRTFGEASTGEAKPKPRIVWEAEGTPEPEKSTQPQSQGRNAQPPRNSRSTQQQPARSAAKPVSPVRRDEQLHKDKDKDKDEDQRTSHSQQPKLAQPQPQRKQSSPPSPHEAGAAKK
ncbi:MAG: DUF6600 domain-containing protein [Candidatus Sulfotelmatobacter sp.]